MAKSKKNTYRKPRMKIPLFTVVGLIPGVSNMHRAGAQKIHDSSGNYLTNLGIEAGRIYGGFDSRIGANPKWNMAWMWEGTFPILIGAVMSKLAGRIGINRVFGKLPIKL